ncbi:transmembrane protein 17B-like [Protobothrops mucrosquamatus]|uniref:transmembrane protein 17B-like n=1 Tax=Protobothrops mucrosquamatus TaxID=103944 RepID=UPI000775E9E9|nr:transmembrane protein 17B-like [Protobothrops mucrosquamatus]
MRAELIQLREVSHLPGLAGGRQRTGAHLEQGQNQNGHRVLSSLPLQMLLYFNVFFLPFWGLSEAIMLELKFSLLPLYYQCLLVGAYLTIVGVESARLFLGYVGNLQEKVPELAGFLLLSVVIEMPVLLFILTDHQVIRMPLEMAVHGVLLCFLTSEIVAASFALKGIARHLARQFYLMQTRELEANKDIRVQASRPPFSANARKAWSSQDSEGSRSSQDEY